MLLMVEKRIRGRLCNLLIHIHKHHNKYMKDYDKNEESSYLKYWDVNNLYSSTMSQKLPVNGFQWVEDLFGFNEDFIKSYNEKSNKEYFLEFDIQYPEKSHEPSNELTLLTEIKKIEKLVANS